MLRHFCLGVLLGIVAPGVLASAADAAILGLARVESYFGEPLRASVEVRAPGFTAGQARLASFAEFTEHGLDRDLLPPGLRLGFDARTGRITVATALPLREPALSLLIRLQRPRGPVFEVVDLIVDGRAGHGAVPPPVKVAAALPRRASGASRPRGRPVPPLPRRSGRAAPEPHPEPSSGTRRATYGPVQPGETLYRIAARVRPDGVRVTEMAMVLFRANPDAFGSGNINLLLAGALLRIPAVTSASRAAAAPPARAKAAAALRAPLAAPVPSPARRLDAAVRSEIRGWIAEQQAARKAAREARGKLRERVERMSRRIAAVRARLQTQGVALRAARDRAERLRSVARPPQAGTAVAETSSPRAAPTGSSRPTTVTAAVEPRNLLLAFLADSLGISGLGVGSRAALILVALATALLAGAAIARRLTGRAKRSISERRSVVREAGLKLEVSAKAARTSTAGDDDTDLIGVPPVLPEAEGAPGPLPGGFDPALSVAASSEAVQAVFREADVYVAYGRFDDAAALLRRGLDEAPGEHELRIKLSEVLFEAGDGAAFFEVAKSIFLRLQETEDDNLWAHVAYLGQQKWPGERLFQQRLGDPAAANHAGAGGEPAAPDAVDELAIRRSQKVAQG